MCIPAPTNRCLGRKKTNKKNKTMAVTTVTITCNWYTLQHWSVSPPHYKPRSNPRVPPDPNTILKYLSAHSKHISCSLFSLWTSWRRWRLREGARKEKHTVANSSLSVNLCMYRRLFPAIEASWHGLNDCIVKMIFGLLTNGFRTHTRTHTLPPWCQGTTKVQDFWASCSCCCLFTPGVAPGKLIYT